MLKKIGAALLAASMLWGCSSNSETQAETNPVEEVVIAYLDDFKAGDLKAADAYIAPGADQYKLGEALDAMDGIYESIGLDQEAVTSVKSALTRMMGALIDSYEVDDVLIQDEDAIAQVSITGITISELEKVQSEDFLNAIDAALSESDLDLSQGALDKALNAMVDKLSELDKSTYQAEFELELVDGVWKIDDISGLMDESSVVTTD